MAAAPFTISPDVEAALTAGVPVVALESAVLTHGLPRDPSDTCPESVVGHADFQAGVPLNLATSLAMERTIRDGGAVPATVAIVDGSLRVGCTAAELERLALDRGAAKASVRDLGPLCAAGACAGTTVSATLTACGLAGIRHFATGGIGGVHRGFARTLDISADLGSLARTPVCVISSGAKSILDLPATVEALEALGIPVVGLATRTFPEFTDGPGTIALHACVNTPVEAAVVCRTHWALSPSTGLLLANPCPAQWVLDDAVSGMADALVAEAGAIGIEGNLVTPWLLAQVAERTQGRSLSANIALLLGNAKAAAAVAMAACRLSAR